MMNTAQYIQHLHERYKLGNATEHTFRGDLQALIESLLPDIQATNEPKRQKCGAPDYILTRKEIPVGFIEAKDIGDKDLKGEKKNGNKEQFDRYKAALNPIIFTDYLDFYLYKNGELITSVAIGKVTDKGIVPLNENFATFEHLLKDFCATVSQNIKSPQKLAQMMAAKARLLADVIEKALVSDEESKENSSLKDQMKAFQLLLIQDISPKGFADVYAQTITYGMFAARLHDPTLHNFSRQEAYELIPKSNPFLKKLFGYIAGLDLDDRIKWIVDSLIEIFLACNVEEILKNYGKSTQQEEPIIHFYETFLSEYDPALRKARGVWYTPAPVVNFMVRAVDDILKSDFSLPQGLADTSKTKIKIPLTDNKGKQVLAEKEVHRVQILDPATGTGTFLAEVVKHINKRFAGQKGIWSSYVEKELLPRLNGFELLMASYAMAHLQLDILLRETGYKATSNERLRIFLTNSLEEASNEVPNLFMAQWLTEEAMQANSIKKDTPVMCVMGNPPYAVSSTNKSDWIQNLIADYKKDLNERNIQPLSDDYIKFIRYGQHFIDKNGSGVLAYISNNSFIDGIIHRQMRKHLLESFDTIYILDLHGNAKKKEVCPDGSPDQNVFDIMQGVSINIFVKTGKKKANELANILHLDLYGKREVKYDFLNTNSLKSLAWNKLEYTAPNFFFVKKDFGEIDEYKKGFKVDELFNVNSSAIKTHRDNLVMDLTKDILVKKIASFYDKNIDDSNIAVLFNLKDNRDWNLSLARKSGDFDINKIKLCDYRPLDKRYCYFDSNLIDLSREKVMQHFIKGENIGLLINRQIKTNHIAHYFLTNIISDCHVLETANANVNVFPLYLYPDTSGQLSFEETAERKPNLNEKIVAQIAEGLGLRFQGFENAEGIKDKDIFTPLDILDYIYAVLHSPTYRETYKEFLKIDFPRVLYPTDVADFWAKVAMGGELRQLHLLESPKVEEFITQYPEDGDNVVRKISYQSGKVYINDTQYFDSVPEVAWNFYIGGYQPAQKWLKDRKERTLSFEDILHYQKIIVALTETDRLMKAIDNIEIN